MTEGGRNRSAEREAVPQISGCGTAVAPVIAIVIGRRERAAEQNGSACSLDSIVNSVAVGVSHVAFEPISTAGLQVYEKPVVETVARGLQIEDPAEIWINEISPQIHWRCVGAHNILRFVQNIVRGTETRSSKVRVLGALQM